MQCTLRLPSGFGEIAILWSKLSSLTELIPDIRLTAELCVDHPRGCEEFVYTLDKLEPRGLGKHTTADMLRFALPPTSGLDAFSAEYVYPTVDQFLISGRHITSWLPELPINYHYPIRLPSSSRDLATSITGGGKYGVIYPSSIDRLHMPDRWGEVWTPDQWSTLIRRIKSLTEISWFILGDTAHDLTMLNFLSGRACKTEEIVRSRSLCDAIALIDEADYFVGFPSGPAVVAGVLGVPHCIPYRYPVQIHHRGSFTDPQMIMNGTSYMPWFTDSPEAVAANVAARVRAFEERRPGKNTVYTSGLNVAGFSALSCPSPPENGLMQALWSLGKDFYVESLGFCFGDVERQCRNRTQPLSDHYRWLYALGRHYQPQQVMEIGTGLGHGMCSVLSGVLDEGVPPTAVSMVDTKSLDYASTIVRRVCERSSLRPDIRAVVGHSNGSQVRSTVGMSSYEMVIVDGSSDQDLCLDDLRWAYQCLSAPGTLVVVGATRCESIQTACQIFCREIGISVDAIPRCCGFLVIKKVACG